MIDPQKMTAQVQQAMQNAQTVLARYQNSQIDVEHLLLAMMESPEGLTSKIFAQLGVDRSRLIGELERLLAQRPKVAGNYQPEQVYITPRLDRLFNQALSEADRMKDKYVSVEHLLIAMAESANGEVGDLLSSAGVTKDRLLSILKEIRKGHTVDSPNAEDNYQALENYGRDLTEMARKGSSIP